MKKVIIFLFASLVMAHQIVAQCSICTKSAQQMGDKTGRGLNLSILYLAFTPLVLIAYMGYRWYKSEKE